MSESSPITGRFAAARLPTPDQCSLRMSAQPTIQDGKSANVVATQFDQVQNARHAEEPSLRLEALNLTTLDIRHKAN